MIFILKQIFINYVLNFNQIVRIIFIPSTFEHFHYKMKKTMTFFQDCGMIYPMLQKQLFTNREQKN